MRDLECVYYKLALEIKLLKQKAVYQTAKSLTQAGITYFLSEKSLHRFFHLIIKYKDIKFLQRLLSKQVNVDSLDEYGYTPLVYATCHRDVDIMQLLLEKGANPNISDQYGETPLYFATFQKYQATTQLLLANGANPNMPNIDGETPLFLAVICKFLPTAQLLLAKGANPDIPNKFKETPLYLAALYQFSNTAQLLLSYGANIEAPKTRDFFLERFITRHDTSFRAFLLSAGLKTFIHGQDIIQTIAGEAERNKLQRTRDNLQAAIEGLIGKKKGQTEKMKASSLQEKEKALNDVSDILRIFHYVLKLQKLKKSLRYAKHLQDNFHGHIAAYLQGREIITQKESHSITSFNVFGLLKRRTNLPSEMMDTIVDSLLDTINIEKIMQRYQLTRARADWGYFHIQAKQAGFIQLRKAMRRHDWKKPFAFEPKSTFYLSKNTSF